MIWIVVAIIIAGVALLVFRAQATIYRYRLTVEVETPEGLRTGSAVREVRWRSGRQITSEADSSSMTHRGEAAMVELPNGQVLFALMSPNGQETPRLAFGSARQTAASDRSLKILKPPLRPDLQFGESGYPRLVRFGDMRDPTTVVSVDPENLPLSFGPGYRLVRITAEIVDDDVTTKIKNRLPWLDIHPEQALKRIHSGNDWSLPASLKNKDFLRFEHEYESTSRNPCDGFLQLPC